MTEKPIDGGLRLTEERLRLAEETAGIGAFDLDLTSDSWVTTPHVAVLFGFAPYVTKPALAEWERAIFVDDRLKLRSAIARAREDGVLSAEFRVTHPDGSVHWLVAKGQAARDSDGAVRWLRGTCFDITERKVLEVRLLALGEALEARVRERTQELEASNARLRESERRFRLLVEGVTDYAIYMLDPEGKVVNWNPGAERLKGYASAEILGQHFSRFYTEEDQAERAFLRSSSATPSRPGSTRARAGVSERTAAGSGRASSSTRSGTQTGSWLALPR